MQLTGGRGRSLRPAAAVLVALALVAAACGSDDDEVGEQSRSPFSRTEAGPPASTGGGSTVTTLPTGGDGGLAIGDAPVRSSPGETDRFGAPTPGRYRYRVPGNDDPHDDFFYWFNDLEHRGDSLVVLRQIYGHGFDNRYELEWMADGSVRILREQRSDRGLAGPVCDWSPDLLVYPAELSVGTEWTAEASCEGGQEDAIRTRSDTARVTGSETLVVDGHTMEVVVIERTEIVTTALGDVEVVERTERTERYSPAVALLVAARGQRVATHPDAPSDPVSFGERLVSPEPEARPE